MKILVRGIEKEITTISLDEKTPTYQNLIDFILSNFLRTNRPITEFCLTRDGMNVDLNEKIPRQPFIYNFEELRLGGKGGFGSLLKGQPPVKKRTNNFDSCRDLTGRRMRHVNQERIIKEWQQKKMEEEKFLKTYTNPNEEQSIQNYIDNDKKKEVQKLNKKYFVDSLDSTESVSESIRFLLRKQKRESKKEEETKVLANKKPCKDFSQDNFVKPKNKCRVDNINNIIVYNIEPMNPIGTDLNSSIKSELMNFDLYDEEVEDINEKDLEEEIFALD